MTLVRTLRFRRSGKSARRSGTHNNSDRFMHQPKIAFYSHDAMGLGHLRRNLLLASTLTRLPLRSQVLLMAGAPELNAFPIPAGVSCVTLPALRKNRDGTYAARSGNMSLKGVLNLRSEILLSTLRTFAPDVLVVDKHPRGLLGELDLGISWVDQHLQTVKILGLRDILDDPESVRRDWNRDGCHAAIRDLFDEVWVYGDPAVYDPREEYDLPPDIAAKIRFLGYLDPTLRLLEEEWGESESLESVEPGPLALCLIGGGQDGEQVARTFAHALPLDMNGIILTGPYLPAGARKNLLDLASRKPRLRIEGFVSNPGAFLCRADRVVTMGGYNSVCEVLVSGKPALVVPRIHPRTEQLIRAERFADLGLATVLRPDHLTTPALGRWLKNPIRPWSHPSEVLDFEGLNRLSEVLGGLLTREPSAPYRIRKAS